MISYCYAMRLRITLVHLGDAIASSSTPSFNTTTSHSNILAWLNLIHWACREKPILDWASMFRMILPIFHGLFLKTLLYDSHGMHNMYILSSLISPNERIHGFHWYMITTYNILGCGMQSKQKFTFVYMRWDIQPKSEHFSSHFILLSHFQYHCFIHCIMFTLPRLGSVTLSIHLQELNMNAAKNHSPKDLQVYFQHFTRGSPDESLPAQKLGLGRLR